MKNSEKNKNVNAGVVTAKKKGLSKIKTLIISVCVSLAVVLGVAGALIGTLGNNGKIDNNLADSSAITSNSDGFGQYATGDKYYYTDFTLGVRSGNTMTSHGVTKPSTEKIANSSKARGTDENPYVITNTTQWNKFATEINAGRKLTSTFVIDAGGTLNFGNATVTPIGNLDHAFQGKLYGNSTVFKNLKFGGFRGTIRSIAGSYGSGLFGNTSNAKIYDITLDSTCVISYITSWNDATNGGYPTIGAFSAISTNPYFVNCHSKMDIVATNQANSSSTCAFGGLVGYATGSSATFVACVFTGKITVIGTAGSACGDNNAGFGGLVGHYNMSTNSPFIELACYLNCDLDITRCGINAGPVGGITAAVSILLKVENSVNRVNLVAGGNNASGVARANNSPDISSFFGYPGGNTFTAGSYVYNSAILGEATGIRVAYKDWLTNSNILRLDSKAYYMVVSDGTAQGDAYAGAHALNASSQDDVKNFMKTNTYIQQALYIDSSGNVTGSKTEPGAGYTIAYSTGFSSISNATGNPTGYKRGGTAVPINNTTDTAPAGLINSGWRQTSVTDTKVIKTTNDLSGNARLYLRWDIIAPTPAKSANINKTYEDKAIVGAKTSNIWVDLTQAGFAGSDIAVDWFWVKDGNASSPHLTNSDTISIKSVVTSGTKKRYEIVFTNPTVADSGTYRLYYTIKSAGNSQIVSLSQAYQEITVKINPVHITRPDFDTATKHYYTGSEQTLAITHNQADWEKYYTVTNNKATNVVRGVDNEVETIKATASLKDKANYTWDERGSFGTNTTDSTYDWGILPVDFDVTNDYSKGGAARIYAKPTAGNGYVGQALNKTNYEFITDTAETQYSYAKYKNAAGAEVDVAGTYEWKLEGADLIIQPDGNKTESSYKVNVYAYFVPTDRVNFEVYKKLIAIDVSQMYLTISHVTPGVAQMATKKVQIDYNKDITFTVDESANPHGQERVNVKFYKGGVLTTESFTGLNGYKAGLYQIHSSTGSVGDLSDPAYADYLKSAVGDKTVYVDYESKYVDYTVYHVKADGDGNYASRENILLMKDNEAALTTLLVEKVKYPFTDTENRKKTGEIFSPNGKTKSYVGFTYDEENTPTGEKLVGDGSAAFFIYYARGRYRLTYEAAGADVPVQTKYFNYEEAITAPEHTPQKDNTNFAGWYYGAGGTGERVDFATAKMPGNVLTIYAKFNSTDYTAIFNINLGTGAGQLNTANVIGSWSWNVDGLFGSLPHAVHTLGYEVTYNVETLTSNLNLLGIKPIATGYDFAGWVNAADESEATSLRAPSSTTQETITLKAVWRLSKYTVRFNTTGGTSINSKSVENMSEWSAVLPETPPTRRGYNFVGWAPTLAEANKGARTDISGNRVPAGVSVPTMNSVFSVRELNGNSVYGGSFNLGNITFYAVWDSKPNDIVTETEGQYKVGEYGVFVFSKDGQPLDLTNPDTKVQIGDVIDVRFESASYTDDPESGEPVALYKLDYLTVNGRKLSSAATSFTVTETTDSTMKIGGHFTPINFSITYDVNGGRMTQLNAVRRFNVNTESVELPTKVTLAGYTLAGWTYVSDTDRYANTPLDSVSGKWYLNKTDVVVDEGTESRFDYYRNITLVAQWKPLPAEIRLYNAYYTEEYSKTGDYYYINNPEGAEETEVHTGAEIEILNPNHPTLDFLGWATKAGGAMVYPAVEGQDYITYTVKMATTVGSDNMCGNELYAIWQLGEIEYLQITAKDNGKTYGNTVTMTVTPSNNYMPVQDKKVELEYNWYKVIDDSKVFDYVPVDGVWVDGNGNFVEEGTEGAVPYKRKVLKTTYQTGGGLYADGSKPWNVTDKFEVTDATHENKNITTLDRTLVSESGEYICVVTQYLDGVLQTLNNGEPVFGEFEVLIEKADYKNLVLGDNSLEYNGYEQTLTTLKNNGAAVSGTTITLPDGSVITVEYKYYSAETAYEEGSEIPQVEHKNVGVYRVVAEFAFTNDKGNYNLPTSETAFLTITPKTLSNIEGSIVQTTGAEGGETKVVINENGTTSVPYNGKDYKVEIAIKDTYGLGGALVTEGAKLSVDFTVYKLSGSGAQAEGAAFSAAGSYYADIAGLTGDDAANFRLSDRVVSQLNFAINKAKHDMSGVKFISGTPAGENEDGSAKYEYGDGSEVTGNLLETTFDNKYRTVTAVGLPENVEVEYEIEYTPEDGDFEPEADPAKPDNGGKYAGEYTVTAVFTTVEALSENYEEIADKTVTLKIKKAEFLSYFDGSNIFGNDWNGGSYNYDPVNDFRPTVTGGELSDPARYELTYRYYWQQSSDAVSTRTLLVEGTATDITNYGKTDGESLISASGYYEVIVDVEYVNPLISNNLNEIPEASRKVAFTIAAGTVERIEVKFKDGFKSEAKVGESFSRSDISAIWVYYENVAAPAKIEKSGLIEVCDVQYGEKDGIEQSTFWKVGEFDLTIGYYGKTETHKFSVTQEITEVALKYSTDGEHYSEIPELGLELKDGTDYTFKATYTGTDKNGKADAVLSADVKVKAENGLLVRGVNELEIVGTSAPEYVFTGDGVKVDVICYVRVADADVKWEYLNGGSYTAMTGDRLPYKGSEYKFRVSFKDKSGTKDEYGDGKCDDGEVKNASRTKYVISVGLTKNYYLVEAKLSVEIQPIVLEFNWSNLKVEYNGTHRDPVATVKNAAVAGDIEGIKIRYDYSDATGSLTTAQVINVGAYTVTAVIEPNVNYTVLGSGTASQTFEIVKADIEMSAEYNEAHYGVNTTYANNPQGLRAEKLSPKFDEGQETVAGTFKFVKNYNTEDGSYEELTKEEMVAMLTGTSVTVHYVFVPTLSSSYNEKHGTVTLSVKAQELKQGDDALAIEFGRGASRFYQLNTQFSQLGLEVYTVYGSYYSEGTSSYGRRDKLEVGTNVQFHFQGESISAHGQVIDSSRVHTVEGFGDCIIIEAMASVGGNLLYGTINIPVTDKEVDSLELSPESEYSAVYYVGQLFDASGLTFIVNYKDGTDNYATVGAVVCNQNGQRFTVADVSEEFKIEFEFFGKKTSITVAVRQPENLKDMLAPEMSNIQRVPFDEAKGEAAIPAVVFEIDGKKLKVEPGKSEIEGVEITSVQITGIDGAPNDRMTAEGKYSLRYEFSVTNPRFMTETAFARFTREVEATKVKYFYDWTAPTTGLTRVYDGKEHNNLPEVVISNIKSPVDENDTLNVSNSRVHVEYYVDGKPEGSYSIKNAGSYVVTVEVKVDGVLISTADGSEPKYTITITRAEAIVTLSVGDVKYGDELKITAEATFGVESLEVRLSSDNEESWGAWTKYSEFVKPAEVGNYVISARVRGTENYVFDNTKAPKCRFSIKQAEINGGIDESGETIVKVENSGDGNYLEYGYNLNVKKIEDLGSVGQIKKQTIVEGYNIVMQDSNGAEVQPEGKVKVRLLISEELRGRNDLKVYRIEEDGSSTDMSATLSEDGKYMEFETEHFSNYIITYPVDTVPVGLLVGVIVCAVVAAGLVAACIVTFILKKKRGNN